MFCISCCMLILCWFSCCQIWKYGITLLSHNCYIMIMVIFLNSLWLCIFASSSVNMWPYAPNSTDLLHYRCFLFVHEFKYKIGEYVTRIGILGFVVKDCMSFKCSVWPSQLKIHQANKFSKSQGHLPTFACNFIHWLII